MIERLQNHPNITRSAAGAALLGTLAAGGVYKVSAASNHEAAATITSTESQQTHDENMQFVHEVRASIAQEARLQASRNKQRVEQAIPTPYDGPTSYPKLSPPAPAAVTHSARPTQAANRPTTTYAPQDLGANQKLAETMAATYGWTGTEWVCLDKLWTRESHYNAIDKNPYSGAYGIPQALPGKKMASAGSDWATNPATQITWGLGYIVDRYGEPCAAEVHSEQYNWY